MLATYVIILGEHLTNLQTLLLIFKFILLVYTLYNIQIIEDQVEVQHSSWIYFYCWWVRAYTALKKKIKQFDDCNTSKEIYVERLFLFTFFTVKIWIAL